MTTPDQPSTPPLTRRQLRELRNTASTPIITSEEAQADVDASQDVVDDAPIVENAPVDSPHSESIESDQSPIALADDADLDPDVHPVTRRQARHLAKLRTGTVDVVETEPAPEDASRTDAEAVEFAHGGGDEEPTDEDEVGDADEQSDAEASDEFDVDVDAEPDEVDEPEVEEPVIAASDEPATAHEVHVAAPSVATDAEQEPARVVAPELGAQLLEDGAAPIDLPSSFDHLLTRGGSGSSAAPNALILSQTPETGSLSVPILGTGELIITGSYALPDSYGSTGSTPGSSDGKDVDESLIDGELPPASSPTPIAASSAISTIKSADDIIRPPAPEKGSRLIMTLAICAGALGLALATVLILTVVNGVF